MIVSRELALVEDTLAGLEETRAEASSAFRRADAALERARRERDGLVRELTRGWAKEVVEDGALVLALGTTGVEVRSVDQVVEIVLVGHDREVAYRRLVKPKAEMGYEASRIHGHTAESLAGEPAFSEVVESYRKAAGGRRIVAWGGGFERDALARECERAGIDPSAVPMPDPETGSAQAVAARLEGRWEGGHYYRYVRHDSPDRTPRGVADQVWEIIDGWAAEDEPEPGGAARDHRDEVDLDEEDFEDIPFIARFPVQVRYPLIF